MSLFGARREALKQRDRALIQVVQLQARVRDLTDELERVRAEKREAAQALERVLDNALFAAGCTPAFHPEDPRFKRRDVEQQQREAAQARQPLSPAQWRGKVEKAEAEAAERDRKAGLRAELQAEAQQRKQKEKPDGK